MEVNDVSVVSGAGYQTLQFQIQQMNREYEAVNEILLIPNGLGLSKVPLFSFRSTPSRSLIPSSLTPHCKSSNPVGKCLNQIP